jgi:hypothetical protein
MNTKLGKDYIFFGFTNIILLLLYSPFVLFMLGMGCMNVYPCNITLFNNAFSLTFLIDFFLSIIFIVFCLLNKNKPILYWKKILLIIILLLIAYCWFKIIPIFALLSPFFS